MNIAFTFNQVKFILYNYWELSHGRFPGKARAEDLGLRFPLQPHAAFEAACLLAGEVALRVKRCGIDGMITEAVFMSGKGLRPEKEVASEYHLDEMELHRRIRRVVAYCEGEDARAQKYDDWRRQNRFRSILRKACRA